jgi:hypothetical protein
MIPRSTVVCSKPHSDLSSNSGACFIRLLTSRHLQLKRNWGPCFCVASRPRCRFLVNLLQGLLQSQLMMAYKSQWNLGLSSPPSPRDKAIQGYLNTSSIQPRSWHSLGIPTTSGYSLHYGIEVNLTVGSVSPPSEGTNSLGQCLQLHLVIYLMTTTK